MIWKKVKEFRIFKAIELLVFTTIKKLKQKKIILIRQAFIYMKVKMHGE